MKKLIIETIFEAAKIEEVDFNGAKQYIMSGPMTITDTPNDNNRIYPSPVMQATLEKLKCKVAKKQIRMSLDHPVGEGRLSDAAALMIEISDIMPDKKAYYKAQIMDTRKGKDLKAMLDAGAVIGVSTRGYGEALYDQEWPGLSGKFTVIREGFELETADFVDTPSVKETMDDITLESLKRSESRMKTIEDLRKENPETFEAFDKSIADEKKILTDKIESLVAQVGSTTENFNKIADLLKTVKPELFVTIPESEIVANKEAEIKTLTTNVETLESSIVGLKTKIESVEANSVKIEKEKKIESLRASDVEFFKVPSLVAKFESCVNSDEVQKVYESNKALLNDVKSTIGGEVRKPKTQTLANADQELDEAQAKDLKSKNEDRRANGLVALTTESYLKSLKK